MFIGGASAEELMVMKEQNQHYEKEVLYVYCLL